MDSMGALWTCPECETINDGQEKCVVCGMTYEKAKELYENQKKSSRLKIRTVAPPSKEKVRFYKKPDNFCLILSIIAILFSVTALYLFSAFFAGAAIALAVTVICKRPTFMAICGLCLSGTAILAILLMYIMTL